MSPQRVDLTGQTFGRLIAVRSLPSSGAGAKTKWECACACGNTAEVRTSRLLSGQTQSCGCRARDVARQRRPWQRRNLKGQRFGRLLVLRASPTNLPPTSRSLPGGATAWVVLCDCSRVVIIATRDLTRPKNPVQDCGCSRLKPAAPVSSSVPLKTTSSAEALRQHHNSSPSGLGQVRRVWPVDEADEAAGVIHDFDPFAFNPD